MKDHVKGMSLVSTIVLALLIALLVPAAFAATPTFSIAPIDSAPYGRTYGEWSAAWQQWAIGIPADSHPLFDTGPADTGQSGPVFFLGGKFCKINATDCGTDNVVRRVTVPSGKALYFPVSNAEWSAVETGAGKTKSKIAIKDINTLRQMAQESVNAGTNDKLLLEIDGQRVDVLRQRVQSDAFSFYLPAGDLFTAVGEGTFTEGYYFPGVDEGYYIMLNALPAGKEHKIHFHVEVPEWKWVMDVTYYVTWLK